MTLALYALIFFGVLWITLRKAYQLGRHHERREHFSAVLRPDDSIRQRL